MEDQETLQKIYTNILKFMERSKMEGNEAFAYIEAYKYISLLLSKLDAQKCMNANGKP
jgi:hypothetical protein